MYDSNAVPIIRFEGVCKEYKGRSVLSDVNLEVKSKEIFGIIGLSGSGKTTLLNLLIGFIKPSDGDILFHAEHLLEYDTTDVFRSVFARPKEVKKLFGFASQYPSFYSELSVIENLRYFGSLYNLSSDLLDSNIHSLLYLMDLYEAKDVLGGHLSGGMQRRLDIACALIHDPKVLILDEPTSDLDVQLRKHIWHLLRKINEKGTTILLSSHHLEDLEYSCDKIAIINDSKIISFGTPDDLKNSYAREVEIQVETVRGQYERMLANIRSNIVPEKTREFEHKLFVYTTSVEDSLNKIMQSIVSTNDVLLDLIVRKPSLQEVFESLTKSKNTVLKDRMKYQGSRDRKQK